MENNACKNCEYNEKCGKPERPMKCEGFKDRDEAEEERLEHFRMMDCDDCVCNKCQGACLGCHECLRAEYAEMDWEDQYSTECEGYKEGEEDG